MDSNTHSASHSAGTPAGFSALVAELQNLADQDPDELADGAVAERVMTLRGLVDRLEGQWLGELAAVDARGAAGAEEGVQAGSTAGWLRHRLRMSPTAAAGLVRTARALYRGPLTQTGQAVAAGELSPAHASVLAHGTHDLPDHVAAEAEPVLPEAARRLDPPRLRRAVAHLRLVADPEAADDQAERRYQQRGCGWRRPGRGWWPSTACWTRRPARCWWRRWSRWPARPAPTTPAPVCSAAPMPWWSWPAAAWKPVGCPRAVGCDPS
jgi:hypothetical protein